jgi:putative ABC transport system permease protein
VVVTDELLLRLGVATGDELRLGEAAFRIVAVVTVEPDRMTGSFNVGPRVLMTREGLERSGLIQRGSRASQRFLVQASAAGAARHADDQGGAAGAGDGISQELDCRLSRDPSHDTPRFGPRHQLPEPSQPGGDDRRRAGRGMAMHSHLQQRLDTIAIMKCIGARSQQILRIYLLQTLVLGLAGSLLGVSFGYGVQAWAPRLIANYFPSAPDFSWEPVTALQAMLIGVLTTLLFSLPPLLSIRKIRPALIFRRDMEGRRKSLAERLRGARSSLIPGALIVGGLAGDGGLAEPLGSDGAVVRRRAAGQPSGAVRGGVAAAAIFGKAAPLLPFRLPTALRHGIANLHRPGVHAEAILVALGVGVTFTLSVYLIQSSVLGQMAKSAPPDMPNVFLMNITNQDRAELETFLRDYPGTEDVVLTPSAPARLLSVDGVPLEQMQINDEGLRFRQTMGVTWFDGAPPEEIDVLDGRWWAPDEPRYLAAVRDDVAETLGIKPGAALEWMVGGETVAAEVSAIYRVETIRPSSSGYFVLTRSALEGRPASFYGGVRIAPDKALDLQRDAYDRFPSVLVINVADVIGIVQEVVDQIAVVVQFVSAFAILGGIVILTSSVMASRFRRIRETAILKVLGATRRKVAGIFSVEFLLLGLAAGGIGALLASGFSALLLERVLDAQYEFQPWPALLAALGTALLANAAGWLASFRILGRKPLEVLRGE